MKKILTITIIFLSFFPNLCFANNTTNINNGRYVMYMNPQFRGDQFILDTKTGKIWRLVSQGKDNADIFEQVIYRNYDEVNDKFKYESHP